MLLSYNALKDKLPDLNERDYSERDILQILARDKVYYAEIELFPKILGLYLTTEDKKEIVLINAKLCGAEKLRTQAHETIHHLIDYPIDDEIVQYFRSMKIIQKRQDITAEALSLILMFSFPTLERFLLTHEISEYLLPYVEERLEILNKYGI